MSLHDKMKNRFDASQKFRQFARKFTFKTLKVAKSFKKKYNVVKGNRRYKIF